MPDEALVADAPFQVQWRAAPGACSLGAGEVHVWLGALDVPAGQVQEMAALLSRDERARAAAFRYQRDHDRYIVARATLRQILGGYLRVAPRQLAFSSGPRGKPMLAGRPAIDIRFNLSHSHGQGVYAAAAGLEVGIDLERLRTDLEFDSIARELLPEEAAAIAAAGGGKPALFFRAWTAREACCKAWGWGLAGGQPQRTALPPMVGDGAQLALRRFIAGSQYVGSLAVLGKPAGIRWWRWAGDMEAIRPGIGARQGVPGAS